MRRLGLILVGVALLFGAARADSPRRVSRSGNVHHIDVVKHVGPAGTSLVHTIQAPNGTQTAIEVAGTSDPAADVEPALAVDPITDQPVLVWSRDEGDGFELFLSRFDGQGWSNRESVAATSADDGAPQIQIGRDLIHIVWRASQAGGDADFMRQSLWRKDLGLAFGPELLEVPGEESGLVPPQGEDGPGSLPEHDDAFFTVELPSNEGRAGRIVVWGIRDEPVPIGYKQGFRMPQELHHASMSSSGWLGDTFAVWFVANEQFYYQLRRDDGWSDLRMIRLTEEMNAADAEGALREMLLRPEPVVSGD